MSEPIYHPTKFLISYWADGRWIISVVDTENGTTSKPYFAQDLRLATAAIEVRLEEIRDVRKN
jgi:hypothetical protein